MSLVDVLLYRIQIRVLKKSWIRIRRTNQKVLIGWVAEKRALARQRRTTREGLPPVMWIRIRIILASGIRIREAKNQPRSCETHIRIDRNHKNIIHFFINIKHINIYLKYNKTNNFLRNIHLIKRKVEQDPYPAPLFHVTVPRIRIHIKMKYIRNTVDNIV